MFGCFKRCVASFRMAGVALRGIRGTSCRLDVLDNVSKVVLHDRRNTFATLSEDALDFSWQVQHFGRVHLHVA